MTNELILHPSLSLSLLPLPLFLFIMVRVKKQTRRDKHRASREGKQARKQLATRAARKLGARTGGVVKKPRRWRPGTVALRNIRKFQTKVRKPLIRLGPLKDVIKHVLFEECKRPDYKGWRLSKETTDAIREYVETDTTRWMKAATTLACRNKKKTLDSSSLNSVLAIEQIRQS